MPVLLLLFFLSGATSLVYQTLWARRLHLVFGTTQLAVATVLAAFMGGLALGGFWMARRADFVERPCRLYGFLELGIGAYALVFPHLLEATTPLTLQFYRSVAPGPVALGVWQLVVVGALLVVPTTCMGATLPLLARFVSTQMGRVGQKVGVLYGVNTLGAVFGVWAGGFILLPQLGQSSTNLLAAGANGLLGLAALALSRATSEGGAPPTVEGASEHASSQHPVPQRALLCIAALSGAAALIYELAWFRLMCLILGGSTYAFSTMLLAFLVGIASGGWAGGRPADAAVRRWGRAGPLACLVGVQLAIGISTAALLWIYPELPYLFVKLYEPGAPAQGLTWARQIWLAVGVMTLPAVFMGATFPLLVRASVSQEALGSSVGRIYGANTLGSLAGAVLAGFVLLPTLHILGTVQVGVALNGLAACVAAGVLWNWGAISPRAAGAGLAAAAAMGVLLVNPPPWNPLWMTAGTYKYVSEISDLSREGVESFAVEDYELLYYDEGFSTVVTVAKSVETGNIWLANNGKVEASTTVDMLTQVLVSHLPFLFRDDAGKAALIGLASGITAGSLTLHEGLDAIEIVELEPSMVEASHAFDAFNHRPLEDPRVQLVLADGRNHLLFAEPGTYDLIVSQPSNPWLSGVSNLFTREFFEMGRERLAPGGVWSQWVQLYGMGQADLKSLLATFADVFPHVALFSTIEDADIVLIGSSQPLAFGLAEARKLMEGEVGEELRDLGVPGPYDLLLHHLMDERGLAGLTEGAEMNTDDNLRIEFSAPHFLHESTASENLLLLLREAVIPELEAVSDSLALAEAYGRKEDWSRGMVVLGRVLKAEPGQAEAADLFRKYRLQFMQRQDD